MPLVSATLEAKWGGLLDLLLPGHPGQHSETSSQKEGEKTLNEVVHAFIFSYNFLNVRTATFQSEMLNR
jgi:hypothetical protein